MRRALGGIAAALAALSAPARAAGQAVVKGVVVERGTSVAIPSARVTTADGSAGTITDGFGRFRLRIAAFPVTLRVTHIGSAPRTVELPVAPAADLRVELAPAPVELAELLVPSAPSREGPIGAGEWQIPLAAIRLVPPAVEPDVFRSLSLVPSVSFSTPLSARPIIRGYDASESIVRIDGYELASPYHFGRMVSAFPAAAAKEVVVRAGMPTPSVGGTLAGTIDIRGRVPDEPGLSGSVDLSLLSATGWLGSTDSSHQLAVAARAVHVAAANLVSHNAIPYSFQDGYGTARTAAGSALKGELTVFGSHDRLFDPDIASGMEWSNVLAGFHVGVLDRGSSTLTLSASGTSFTERATDFPARNSRIDVSNEVRRIGGALDLTARGRWALFHLGAAVNWHGVSNQLVPRAGDDFAASDLTARLVETAVYGDLRHEFGKASLELGARVDASASAVRLQPRMRFGRALGGSAVLGISAGRSSRLYQVVSDPLSEPDLAFYDFWLPAGIAGTAVPSVDHVALDLDFRHPLGRGRVSIFGSHGQGAMELAPPSGDGTAAFRTGSSRTAGLEMHATFAGRSAQTPSASVTYVLSVSQRRWDAGWIPWTLDRRHLFRLTAEAPVTSRLAASTQLEAASAAPMTPVTGVAIRGLVDPAHGGIERDGRSGQAVYQFGPENSTRGRGTFRVDAALSWRFSGPWHSRMFAGLSVVNVAFGSVSPLQPAAPALNDLSNGVATGRVSYERLFSLPAVPTITLRAEF